MGERIEVEDEEVSMRTNDKEVSMTTITRWAMAAVVLLWVVRTGLEVTVFAAG